MLFWLFRISSQIILVGYVPAVVEKQAMPLMMWLMPPQQYDFTRFVERGLIPLLVLFQATTISPQDAAKSVGKQVTVEGVVVQVTHTAESNTTFLNLCAPFPKHCFNAVIFKSAQATFSDAASSEGKKVRVSGVVKLYQGKPEIVLDKREQLNALTKE